jgi:predicted GNAT family N-acyltransferase
MELRVTIAETAEEKNAALALRWDVFVQEQRVPESLEQDEWDATATHFLAYAGDDAVGTARLRPVGPKVAKVERVAVLSPYRKRGIGRALMDKIERYAKDLGMSEMILHAQDRAVPFYKKLGYRVLGDPFEDAGIPHLKMSKPLSGESFPPLQGE